jgi:hypothetical protein
MAAIITDDFRRNQARLLVNDIKASSDAAFDSPATNSNESNWPYRGTNRYSVGLGKTDSWPDNAGSVSEDAVNFVVPVPAGNRQEDEDIVNNLFTLKDVSTAGAKQMIAKNPWTSGRKYKVYDSADNDAFYSTGDLYPCYVTYGSSVYICLSNTAVDNGFTAVLPSTTAPNASADYAYSFPAQGYVWCEVAKIPANDPHVTNQFVPIQRDADVSPALTATNKKRTAGLLSHVGIISGGSGYSSNTVITATVVKHDGAVLSPSIQFTPLIDGSGIIQRVDIRDPQNSPTDAGSYEFWTSGDASALVASGVALTNRIKSINFSVTDSGGGTGAILSATVAPVSGYGKNAIDILPTWFVGLNINFTGTETDGDAPALKFRQVSLLKNFTPNSSASDSAAGVLDTLKYITLSNAVDPFPSLTEGQVLYQAGSGAKFYFDYYDATSYKLYYHQNSNGEVNTIDLITGSNAIGTSSGGSQVAAGATAVTDGEYQSRIGDGEINGEVIFHENRKPFARSASQTEEVKLIIQL